MFSKPQKEHKWLDKLIGTWSYESECVMGPNNEKMKCTGTETVRSIGGLWVVSEGVGEMPGGGTATFIITIGYNIAKKAYAGTFVGSMMDYLWLYDGKMDKNGKILRLHAKGPDCTGKSKKLVDYCDAFEIKNKNHKIMTSSMRDAKGKWVTFMTSHYRRKS